MTQRSLLRVSACALALAAGPILTGCSGIVKNLNSAQVNTPPVTLDNVFNLNGGTASLTLGNTVTTQTFPFTNSSSQSINGSQIVRASLTLGVAQTVMVTAPAGQTLPATFTLTSLSFTPEVDSLNSAGTVTAASHLPTLSAVGTPINLTQTSTPGQYTASSPIVLQTSTSITGTDLTNLITLLNTNGGSDQAVVTLNAVSTTLPAGSVITFTVSANQLVVSASSNS